MRFASESSSALSFLLSKDLKPAGVKPFSDKRERATSDGTASGCSDSVSG